MPLFLLIAVTCAYTFLITFQLQWYLYVYFQELPFGIGVFLTSNKYLFYYTKYDATVFDPFKYVFGNLKTEFFFYLFYL